jgi:hypothetical protein
MLAYSDTIKNFCVISTIIMMLVIYNSVGEVDKYTNIYIQRFMNTGLQGRTTASYAS